MPEVALHVEAPGVLGRRPVSNPGMVDSVVVERG